MKIFAVIPTRNDAWVLERVLATASLWADRVIVADEESTDATPDIVKKFPKARYISFSPKQFNESYRRQVLLDAVREFDGQNLVFGLDADEILTAEVLQAPVLEDFIAQMKPGMSASLQWIMLWKNSHEYRFDQAFEWSANFKQFAYWDDRKIKFEDVRMHSPRVPESTIQNSISFSGFRVLHYAFAEWQRCLAKHVYYLALEKTMGATRHPYWLDRRYHWYEKQGKGGLVIKPLPSQWLEAYKQKGIDMSDLRKQALYWYDVEVLRFFEKFGEKAFKHFNVWAVDWEAKRKLAQSAKEHGLPVYPIINPQPWYDRFFYKVIAPKLYQI